MNTNGALTIGTTDLVFTQFSAAGPDTAGTGLAKSGTVMSIEASQPTITQVGTLNGLTISSSQTVDIGNNKITNVSNPEDGQDVATKAYVDGASQGLSVKLPCKAATTANLNSTYYNGSYDNGFEATLTANDATQVLVVDGVLIEYGDRVLVKDQDDGKEYENGIYSLTTVGDSDSSTAWVLTRATDADTPAKLADAFSFVTYGTTYENIGFIMNTNGALTIGTTDLVFTQFSAAGQVTAGTGLAKSGTEMSIEASQPTITQVGELSSLSVTGNINLGYNQKVVTSKTYLELSVNYPSNTQTNKYRLKYQITDGGQNGGLHAEQNMTITILNITGVDEFSAIYASSPQKLRITPHSVREETFKLQIENISGETLFTLDINFVIF